MKVSLPTAELELTYRCNFNCVHCCCKGCESSGNELTTAEVKSVIDQLYHTGCLNLSLTGGEPLLREDFPEIYLYAVKKGFLVTVLTNGALINNAHLRLFERYNPSQIEISLHGMSPEIFSKVTGTVGNRAKVFRNIKKIIRAKIPLLLKTVGMSINKTEITLLKDYARGLLGPKGFKFDYLIVPKLNRDLAPLNYRLSAGEVYQLVKGDRYFRAEFAQLKSKALRLPRDKRFVFQCNASLDSVSIDPFGRVRPCGLLGPMFVDLKKVSLQDALEKRLPKFLKMQFQTPTLCRDCALRVFCSFCPARSYLEKRSYESPIDYFCELAAFKVKLRDELL